jgi:WD40 repeat protein
MDALTMQPKGGATTKNSGGAFDFSTVMKILPFSPSGFPGVLGSDTMQLTKHWAATLDDYAIDLAWSPDGSLLAAASAAGPISLFATADGTLRHALPGHDDGTNCVAWRRSSQSVDRSSEIEGQNIETRDGSSPVSSKGDSDSELRAPSSEVIASGGQDGLVKFWDAAAGQHTASASLGGAWVEHLAWMGPRLFAAAGRKLAVLHPDGSLVHTFKDAPKSISAIARQPAGGCVAVSYFGGVCLWDADDFVVQKEFPYNNGIQALVWSPDSKWLVSGNQDPSVHLWIPETDIELQMSGYEGKVKHLSFDQTSRWLATSGGRDACIWDCAGDGPEGREPAMLPHDAPVCAVAFQNTHGLLATASQDGVVQLWSPERKQPLRATVKMPVAATKLAWSPDDRYLAIGSEKGAVYVLKSEG